MALTAGKRIAVADLGTNTFSLLIAERGADGGLRIVHSDERGVFLGLGGINKGIITVEAIERGVEVLRLFVDVAHEHGVDRISAFGTSALRNASNAPEFLRLAKSMFGMEITIIQGDREADLILEGTRLAVPFSSKPMLVMDIGGGSVEFILATDKALMWKQSFELGTTRLLEQFLPNDPLNLNEYFRICAYLDAQLQPLFAIMERHWPAALIGSAGAFDTLAELVCDESGEALRADQNTVRFTNSVFDALKEEVIGSSYDERSVMSAVPSYRVTTLPMALLLIERVLAQGIEHLIWSRYALKEGIAWRLLR